MTTTTFVKDETAGGAQNLVAELKRLHDNRRDYVVPARELSAVAMDDGTVFLAVPTPAETEKVRVRYTRHALGQLFDRLRIPRDYGHRMEAERPMLLAQSINAWLARQENSNWLVRLLDGKVRAFASDQYRIMDAHDLFFAVYGTLKEVGAEITRGDITDDGGHFRLRAIVSGWQQAVEVPNINTSKPAYHHGTGGVDSLPGAPEDRSQTGGLWIGRDDVPQDFIYPGITLGTSETGEGKTFADPFLYRVLCKNGLVADDVVRRIHLGERKGEGYLSQEAIEAESRAVWLNIRDLVKAVFDRERFVAMIRQFEKTGSIAITSPLEVVEKVATTFGMTAEEQDAILNEFLNPQSTPGYNPGLNAFGLINAITAQAHKAEGDPERQTRFESIGGQLLRKPELLSVS